MNPIYELHTMRNRHSREGLVIVTSEEEGLCIGVAHGKRGKLKYFHVDDEHAAKFIANRILEMSQKVSNEKRI